jgi:hypothetical protein
MCVRDRHRGTLAPFGVMRQELAEVQCTQGAVRVCGVWLAGRDWGAVQSRAVFSGVVVSHARRTGTSRSNSQATRIAEHSGKCRGPNTSDPPFLHSWARNNKGKVDPGCKNGKNGTE